LNKIRKIWKNIEKGVFNVYYENKKDKKKDKITLILFLTLIVVLLCIVIIKLDYADHNMSVSTEYEVDRLSTNSDTKVEKNSKELLENAVKSVVGISKLEQNGNSIFLSNFEQKLGLGSGVIISENGYILTNQHVAGNKYGNCYVTLENGTTYNGSVIWADSNLDLAIVKITANKLDYMNLADSDKVCLAEDVFAIGNPIGIEFQRTVTKGIISGIDRTIKLEDTESYMEDLIQTDATINEGNSGGALINSNGELIGINTVKISNAEGIGFAVPINIVKPILEKLMASGKFEEAYLGIYGYDKEVIPYLNSSLNISSGVYVATILSDGPLFNKEIIVGDIISKIDNIEINKMNDLREYIYSKSPGEKVKLKIRRGNQELEKEIILGYKS